MINIKNFHRNRINILSKSLFITLGILLQKILSSHLKVNSVNPLHIVNEKADGYIEESNENKYLRWIFTDKNKDTLKKVTKLWDKIKDLIRSVTNTLGDYAKKYMKIKFNLDDNLHLNKILKLHNSTIVVKSVFKENKKYYAQAFLNGCLYEL